MIFEQIGTALQQGETELVRRLVILALEQGMSPEEVLDQALMPAMDAVGQQFRNSEIFIPEVLQASRAMQGGIRILQKSLEKDGEKGTTVKILMGTVAGDYHDIGKNLVTMFMDTKGFDVINLGIDVPPEEFVWGVRKYKPDVLGMSALLTTTMQVMGDTITALQKAGLRDQVKVLVGGGPVTKTFAEEIGADGYAYDARSGVDWILRNFVFNKK